MGSPLISFPLKVYRANSSFLRRVDSLELFACTSIWRSGPNRLSLASRASNQILGTSSQRRLTRQSINMSHNQNSTQATTEMLPQSPTSFTSVSLLYARQRGLLLAKAQLVSHLDKKLNIRRILSCERTGVGV